MKTHIETRTCNSCHVEQTIQNFTYCDKKNGYRRRTCKSCQNVFNRTLPNSIQTRRRTRLKREFGISLEQYDEMLKRQKGKCAVCEELCMVNKNLSVDHDHKTGKIRGLLCFKCNTSLGKLNDDIELVRNLLKYLETWQG